MPNTSVFRGNDATLTLAVEATPEGQAAEEIINFFQLSPVGRASNVEVFVRTELETFHEIGRRHPVSLNEGNIYVSGKVDRAYINGALLRLLLGKGALTAREAEPYPQPSFNLMLAHLGHIPTEPGETVQVDGHTAEVVEVTGRAITKVRLRVAPREREEQNT